MHHLYDTILLLGASLPDRPEREQIKGGRREKTSSAFRMRSDTPRQGAADAASISLAADVPARVIWSVDRDGDRTVFPSAARLVYTSEHRTALVSAEGLL
jgi:hypothetical protein